VVLVKPWHTAAATTEDGVTRLGVATVNAIKRARDKGEATFITDERGGGVVVTMPAANYHDPDECCCSNCPWGHDHAPRPGNT
jgi:hypothetical protein